MMRHITRLGLILIALALFVVIGVNLWADDSKKETINLATRALNAEPKEKVPSKYKEMDLYTKTERTDAYSIETLTPVTKSETVNKQVSEWIENEKQTFIDRVEEGADADASLNINVAVEQESMHYTRLIFQIDTKISDDKTQEETVFNVDLDAEKVLSLDDFLDVDDQAFQAILKHALDLLEQNEEITIPENERQHMLTSSDSWDWFMSQEGLTFIFDGSTITEGANDPIHITMPLQALYLHIHDNINHYVQLSETQQEEMAAAVKAEEERILEAKRKQEQREQEKAEAKQKQEQAVKNANGKYVALTFDDGPSAEVTPRVLEVLKQYNAKATFFMLGSQVDHHPEIAKQVADAGHEIGNHTEQHQDLTKLGPDAIRQEISSTSDKISNATGTRPYLVRPPYGAYNESVINDAASHGDSIILWSVDSLDWQSRNADAINREIQQSITPGAMVLMHDIHPTTADALPELMKTLHQEGYQFVTVSQLMEMQGQDGAGPIYGQS